MALALCEWLGLGDGVRLSPGGVLVARLVTGPVLVADGEPAASADVDEPAGEERPGEGGDPGDGRVTGSGVGWVAPDPARWGLCGAPGDPVPAAPSTDHGMKEARGPPSRPTAITTRHASRAAPAPRPSRRIRRWRRPEMSANTGACSAGRCTLKRVRVRISDRQTVPSPGALHPDSPAVASVVQLVDALMGGRAHMRPPPPRPVWRCR